MIVCLSDNVIKLNIIMFVLLVLVVLAVIIYKWATKNNCYFAKKGIVHEKPIFCFGTTYGIFLKQYGVTQMAYNIYNKYSNEK